MDEKDWLLLKTLSEEMSITKTAQRLYISQPALTYRIKQIEKEFKVSIISRSKNGVVFTTEGEYILDYASRMLSNLRQTKDFVHNISEGVRGTIRLGVAGNFAQYKLPSLLKAFLRQFPEIQMNVTTGLSFEMMQQLKKEEVQISIVRGNQQWEGNKILISKEPICVISNKKIDMEMLPSLPRIDYKTGVVLKLTIDDWWENIYNQPSFITMKVDSVNTCKEMVKHGLGYAIIPSICITPNDDIYSQNISLNNSPLTRETWMYYRESLLKLSSIKAFVDFISAASDNIISNN